MRDRRRLAAELREGLRPWEEHLQLPHPKPERDHSYMMFPILIREAAPFDRESITLFLEERQIETRPMVSILDQPFYRRRFGEDIEKRYPVARAIARRGFYIGCHPEITPPVRDYVLESFGEFFQGLPGGG